MSTTYLFPSTLKGLADVSVSPGVSENNYPLTWNNTLEKWISSNNIAGVMIRSGVGVRTQALGSIANGSGTDWIAQGASSGISNTTGNYWIAQGSNAGRFNTTGANFIAQGLDAGRSSTTGANFIAQGLNSGRSNNTGTYWFAQGSNSGYFNTTGSNFIGQSVNAGFSNVGGTDWIAQGANSGYSNTSGSYWLAQGSGAARLNTTGSSWIAQGFEAGYYDTRSNVFNLSNTRNKSLICGDFANNCIYFGNVGPITSSYNVPTPTAAVHAAASTTARASLRIDAGLAPTAPYTGDVWMNLSNNSLTLNFPLLNLGNKQVLTTTRIGWVAPTGTATRGAFDTATVTVEELAQRLKALIDDLTTHGLIGT